MRAFRVRNLLLTLVVLAGVPGVFPALAADCGPPAPASCSGTVMYPWVSPSGGEVINTAAGNGTFGYAIVPADPRSWAGKRFALSYPSDTADLDVYFYTADPAWDFSAGVHEAPGQAESGQIPANAQRAFVMISYTTPTESAIPFTFTVSA